MKIIYAYEQDANDINAQSGRPYHIQRQLLDAGCTIVPVFPLKLHARRLFGWKRTYHRIRGHAYYADREPLALASLAQQIERHVRHVSADWLFAPGSHAVAHVDSPHPKVLAADATFANVIDFYASFTNLAAEYIAMGHEQDRRALANCTLAIYPSEWAARSARQDYGAEPGKVHVIPFGANSASHAEQDVENWIGARRFDEMRVLFVGQDWKRKGGQIMLDACAILHRSGVRIHLDIVGVERPPPLPAYAASHGFLNKAFPADRRALEELYARAHFLFVPSRAENYGLVYCEAAAHGVPSIASDVGGVSTIVRTGVTGHALPVDSPPQAYAEAMLECFTDAERYRSLARASFNESRLCFTWRAFAQRLLEILRQYA